MDICMTPAQMGWFLELTNLQYVLSETMLILKAATRDVIYSWDGALYCYSGGVAS